MKRNQFKLGLFLTLTLATLLSSQSTTRAQEGPTSSVSLNHELNPNQPSARPIVIGHRGASGFRPE
jgi:glycerophosphoryl diester phosphodiesterase